MSSKRILANDLVLGSAMHPGQLLKDERVDKEYETN
jgi:hypothetical protein